MAHFAGLVAAGLHPSPVPHSDVVTSTVHKTLAGPRSGVILAKQEWAKKLNSAVFPGQQGGPLMHVIAAKAVAFKIAGTEEFKERQERVLEGARILAERLSQADVADAGVSVLTGGTDVHLVLVDLRNSQLDGQQAEDLLHAVGITVNRNAVPFDPRPPMVTSGLRIGTPALATRGFGAEEFTEVADIIATALKPARRRRRGPAGPRRQARRRLPAVPAARAVVGHDSAERKNGDTARILDGKATAAAIKAELTERVAALEAKGVTPGLGTVLVGDDPGCTWYVGGKHKDCAEVGITSIRGDLPGGHHPGGHPGRGPRAQRRTRNAPATSSSCRCPAHRHRTPSWSHGPGQGRRRPAPDQPGPAGANVSGPMNSPLPCTPKGSVELLTRHGIDLKGKRVLVVGRGVTIGRPVGLLLTRKDVNATVILAHTGTVDLPRRTPAGRRRDRRGRRSRT